MEQQLVVFELAGENYGIDISSVEGIIKMQPITKMPQAPTFVEGIINLRGVVVPVIDLRKRFSMPPLEHSADTRIVNVFMGKAKIGMIVDGVSEVLRIPEEAIEPTPAMISTVNTSFIRGIAKLDNRLVTLLDLDKILSAEEQALISRTTQA
ncbi:MAG: chemotaxis protein CheW [Leptolinea sp.]|jgi:purine-binding chemotaxis protein CheW|nr:chemotaxis protein CheW [Leptolinea sp.]